MKTERGLSRRVGRELLLQALYISLAVLVSVFVAAGVVQSILTREALKGEARYYWERETQRAGSTLPDTLNLTGYREGFGDGVPDNLLALNPGFHALEHPREILVYVSEQGPHRLFLVFETGKVSRLITLFGLIPLALALIVIYLSLYIAYRVSRRAVSPIENLAAQVRHLDLSDPKALLAGFDPPDDPSDEIRVLSDALQDLADRVAHFVERERRFTRDASHELRTPLTVIKIAVDRLLRDHRLEQDNEETLLRIRNSCDDMERLTKAFLLMARESDEGLSRQWVCLNDIIETEIERAQIVAPNSQTEVQVHAAGRFEVSAPEKAVESVVGNLLRNAIAYTDQGRVEVTLERNRISIQDTGPGMSPQEVEKAFQPWERNRRQRGGFGVGLTIVRRLCDRFDWPLDISSEVGQGTCVTVTFPTARHSD